MWIGAAPERPLGTSAWVEPCAGTESAPATSHPTGPGGNAPGGGRHLSRCRHRHVRRRRACRLRTITPRRPRPGVVTRPGRGYPGKVTRGSLPARYIGRSSARTSPSALPNALDAPCWATRGTDTPGSRASGPHVPRSCGKTGGLETPGGARTLSTMPARVCGNGGPSILLGTSRDLSEPPIEARGSFVSIHLRKRLRSVRPKKARGGIARLLATAPAPEVG